jgi:hypothetical protein
VTLLIAIFALYNDLIKEEKELIHEDLPVQKLDVPYLDKIIRDRKFFKPLIKRTEMWKKVIERVVLGFSDQQLVTGSAILLAGFIRISSNYGQLKMYHLVLVSDMAWLSANTHLLTLVILRRYFQQYSFIRAVRATGMLVLATALILVSVFTSHQHTYDYYICPAECLIADLQSNVKGTQGRWLIANVILVCWNYPSALIPLFDRTRKPLERLVLNLERYSREHTSRDPMKWVALATIYFFYHFLGSNVFAILELTGWFVIGVYWAVSDRLLGQSLMKLSNENVLGFGQFVPLFLILIPIFMAVEIYCGTAIP